jgi:hypothetical protein
MYAFVAIIKSDPGLRQLDPCVYMANTPAGKKIPAGTAEFLKAQAALVVCEQASEGSQPDLISLGMES